MQPKRSIQRVFSNTPAVGMRLSLQLETFRGMRIGEVLKLLLGDLQDRKLVLREPKSGKEYEFVHPTKSGRPAAGIRATGVQCA